MSELEDLLVKYYRVEKIGGLMVVTEDEKGKYRAACAEDVEAALTLGNNKNFVDVKIGNNWYPIRHPTKNKKKKRKWKRQYI